MSGSMAPTIDTGDVVVLKRLERPARLGDIVSIPVPEEARARFGYPPVVIHRIVAIDATGAVTTKGDARKEPDPFSVPSTALTTRVVASVPAAGRALAFLGSPLGLLWLVGGAGMLLGLPLLERHRDGQRRVQGERDGLQAALEAVTAELAALRADEIDHEARLTAEAAARHAAAEAHQQALARAAEERQLSALAAEAHQQALAEAAAAQAQLRDATAAFARHLEELPALIERAIADAFASAAPAPPPPPVPEPVPAARARRAEEAHAGSLRQVRPRLDGRADTRPAGRPAAEGRLGLAAVRSGRATPVRASREHVLRVALSGFSYERADSHDARYDPRAWNRTGSTMSRPGSWRSPPSRVRRGSHGGWAPPCSP